MKIVSKHTTISEFFEYTLEEFEDLPIYDHYLYKIISGLNIRYKQSDIIKIVREYKDTDISKYIRWKIFGQNVKFYDSKYFHYFENDYLKYNREEKLKRILE